jgi:hypothetical protein
MLEKYLNDKVCNNSNMAYIIMNNKGRNIGNRLYKTLAKAESAKKGLVKNNSLEQRRQTGYIGLRVKRVKPYKQEVERLKIAKDFIFR